MLYLLYKPEIIDETSSSIDLNVKSWTWIYFVILHGHVCITNKSILFTLVSVTQGVVYFEFVLAET